LSDSQAFTFADPDAFRTAIRTTQIELLLTQKGDFRADLVRAELNGLWMQQGSDCLPRIVRATTMPERASILFLSDKGQAPFIHSGAEVTPSDLVFYCRSDVHHHRTQGACRWGTLSIPAERLPTVSLDIAGREVAVPSETRVFRPAPQAMARLVKLHGKIGNLFKTRDKTLEHPAIVKALEQELTHAMVDCLANEPSAECKASPTERRRALARFEDYLEAKQDEAVYLTDLCTAIGVSQGTLRSICRDQVGVSPIRYLWLRRMNLAHIALLRADATARTVTEIATGYGFWELGRFSVEYRTLFGERPSETLRRSPH
jgi:AraC-like DNA-binding protein